MSPITLDKILASLPDPAWTRTGAFNFWSDGLHLLSAHPTSQSGARNRKKSMKTISAMIASVTLLVALALPAVADAAQYSSHASEPAFSRAEYGYNAFNRQVPSEFNEHAYHGGPKYND